MCLGLPSGDEMCCMYSLDVRVSEANETQYGGRQPTKCQCTPVEGNIDCSVCHCEWYFHEIESIIKHWECLCGITQTKYAAQVKNLSCEKINQVC